jgi:hypothetical protein
MLKKVLLGILALVAIFAIVVATRPDTYHVQRSTKIEAPADVVFATVNDFQTFAEWSPWAKMDPAMRTTISTPSSGVGAKYEWSGNKQVGKGRMTIVEATAPTHSKEKLEFLEPFPGQAEAVFDIKPNGNVVDVTWSMTGKANFIGKAFGLFVSMDKMIGKTFDDGLVNLKRVSEAKRAAAATAAAPPAEPAKVPAAAPAKPATEPAKH